MEAELLNPFPFLFLLLVALSFFVQVSVHAFSVDLIHRDSPQSPFYDPSATKYDRLNDAFRRSISRASYLSNKSPLNSSNCIKSQLNFTKGEYLMKLSIGTPPVSQFAIVDTNTDVTWFQCKPCKKCFQQRSQTFDPKKSSTYSKITCNDTSPCKAMRSSVCSVKTKTCVYFQEYKKSYTLSSGDVSTETFTFQSTSKNVVSNVIPKVTFGCGYDNYESPILDGVIGLGYCPDSIVNQTSTKTLIGGKFSYCLPHFASNPNAKAKIRFGKRSIVRGSGVVTTPIKTSPDPFEPYYSVTIESISVNNNNSFVAHTNEPPEIHEDNDIVLELGTTFTFIYKKFYTRLETEVLKAIPAKAIPDPEGNFHVCYSSKDKIKFPKITFRFRGGAEVELPEENAFTRPSSDIVCLAIVPAEYRAIFGSLAQTNFLVGFDVVRNVVSFKPSDCNKWR